MPIPAQLVEIIRHKIQAISQGKVQVTPWEQQVAASYGLLPLYSDLGGDLALDLEGEIISIPDDPSIENHIELDPIWRNTVWAQLRIKYPELKSLIPPRPADAIDCPDCQGTGISPVALITGHEFCICRCGGMGWLSQEYSTESA